MIEFHLEADILSAINFEKHSPIGFSFINHITMSQLVDFDRMFRLDGKIALVTGGKCIGPSKKDRRAERVNPQAREDLVFTLQQRSFVPAQRK
jgi:hypothetical protein